MAMAKKCDRCGKMYEYYDRQIDKCSLNGMALITKSKSAESYRVKKDYDLCGDCLTELIEWFEGGEKK